MKKMVSVFRYIVFSSAIILFTISEENFTRIYRRNILLSRRKRYLGFPMGSSLVMTISATQALLQVQPRGFTVLGEVDVPFALPSDTRFYKKKKMHHKERRYIYSQLDWALTQNGLNGTACVKRMICNAQMYVSSKAKSLVRDFLLAIFSSAEAQLDIDYRGCYDKNIFLECSIPFLEYILGSPENKEHFPD